CEGVSVSANLSSPRLRGEVAVRQVRGSANGAGAQKTPFADHPHAFQAGSQAISARTIAAPSAIAFILPKADSRGRYLSPQSGATTIRSGDTWGSARRMR